MVIIYVPVGSEEEARHIGRALLEERLIACANVFPIRSLYRWEGELREEGETVVILKTRKELYDECARRLTELHSYDVPCLAAIPVDRVNDPYLAWLRAETVSCGR